MEEIRRGILIEPPSTIILLELSYTGNMPTIRRMARLRELLKVPIQCMRWVRTGNASFFKFTRGKDY